MNIRILPLMLILCGCSHTTKIGKPIGNRQFYKVQATSYSGPSVVMIVSMEVGTSNAVVEQAFAGNGLAPAVVGSAGIAAGSVLWGHSFKGDNVTVVNEPEKIAEPDPIEPPKPPAIPPGLRPPDTVPHKKPHYSRVPELWHKATDH